jgi:RecA-family ATPase
VLSGLCAALQGDSTVVNPSRIMRLIGSIAWPVKDGRITERTEIIRLQTPGATEYMAETIERLCVDANWQQNAKTMPDSNQDRAVSSLGFVGNVTDGREAYMRNTILAVLGELCAEHGAAPTTEELFEAAWPQYSANVDLTREGRGQDEFLRKVRYTLNRFDMGRIASMPTLEAAVASGLAKKAQSQPNMMATVQAAYDGAGAVSPMSDKPALNASQKDDDTFQLLDATDLRNLPPPQWLVDGIIPENGLTFLYGQRGKGKSFVTLDAALHIASGSKWLGRDTKAGGVIYCAGEGLAGYGVRVEGWTRQHAALDVGNFRLMPLVPNFRDEKEVAKLARTIKQQLGDAKLIIIDTVARAIPGAEENSSKDMGLFVAACDAIRQTCGVAVIGVHHSGKDDERGMRGSSALEGAGDAVIHLRRLEGNLVEITADKMKDGEEFRPIIMALDKVEWIDDRDPLGKPRSTLVPKMQGEDRSMAFPNPVAMGSILRTVDTAWKAGEPFSLQPQRRQFGKYLPAYIARMHNQKEEFARSFCEELLAKNVIQIERYKDENYNVKNGISVGDFVMDEVADDDEN